MKDKLNCPNCGAPITGYKCEYCGTVFYDFADLETGQTAYLRLKHMNRIVDIKVLITDFNFESTNLLTFYCDSEPYYLRPDLDLRINAEPIPDEDGTIYKIYDLEKMEEHE